MVIRTAVESSTAKGVTGLVWLRQAPLCTGYDVQEEPWVCFWLFTCYGCRSVDFLFTTVWQA